MLSRSDIAVIRGTELFSRLPEAAVETLLRTAGHRTFERGAEIFSAGAPAKHVFIVVDGWLKLFRVSDSGGEAVIQVLTRGMSVAEEAAFEGATYPVSAVAAAPCRLVELRTADLIDLARRDPDVAAGLLGSAFRRTEQLLRQIEQLKTRTGSERVAEFLLELCVEQSGPQMNGAAHANGHAPDEPEPKVVTLPYDKGLIAGRLGIQPQSLSRAFIRLRDAGVEINQRQARISDIDALQRFVGQRSA